MRPTNPPTLVPSATPTVAPWTGYWRTSCEGTKSTTIRSISGGYRPKVLSNCKSTCEYYDECVGFNYWDDNEVQETYCTFYSDITATPAYTSETRPDYYISSCYVQSHKLLSLSSSSGVNKYEREGWTRILASDPILESSTDFDSTISIMFDWKDQGYGNRKGKARILLLSDDGTIVAQKTYQYAPRNWETREEILNLDQDLVNLARVGYSYAVEVMAGWGGGHALYLRDFELETNFAFVSTIPRRRLSPDSQEKEDYTTAFRNVGINSEESSSSSKMTSNLAINCTVIIAAISYAIAVLL